MCYKCIETQILAELYLSPLALTANIAKINNPPNNGFYSKLLHNILKRFDLLIKDGQVYAVHLKKSLAIFY